MTQQMVEMEFAPVVENLDAVLDDCFVATDVYYIENDEDQNAVLISIEGMKEELRSLTTLKFLDFYPQHEEPFLVFTLCDESEEQDQKIAVMLGNKGDVELLIYGLLENKTLAFMGENPDIDREQEIVEFEFPNCEGVAALLATLL